MLVAALALGCIAAGAAPATRAAESDPTPPVEAAPTQAAVPSSHVPEGACPAPPTPETPVPDQPLVMPEDFRIALFDAVWGAVNELYIVPDFNGVDWEQIQEEYAPYFLQTDNAFEVYALLEEMVGRLEDPSSRFLSALALEAAVEPEPGYAGIGALVDTSTPLVAGEGLRILYIFPGSGAEAAGLQARDRIIAVEGNTCPRIDIIRGPEGTEVNLEVASPRQAPHLVSVERRRIEGTILPIGHRLDRQPEVGYLRIVSLAGANMLDDIQEALQAMLDEGSLEGLVIDLRSTTAGVPAVTAGVLGQFVDGDVATQATRAGEVPLEVEPGPLHDELADVPVIVFLDQASAGEAEHLGAILQSNERARIVGQQTPGTSYGVRDLPLGEGSILQLPVAAIELPDGTRLQGRGVSPDVEVEEDWLEYPEDEDPYLVPALELLGERSATNQPSKSPAYPDWTS
jgi:C-terminal peptidase prc